MAKSENLQNERKFPKLVTKKETRVCEQCGAIDSILVDHVGLEKYDVCKDCGFMKSNQVVLENTFEDMVQESSKQTGFLTSSSSSSSLNSKLKNLNSSKPKITYIQKHILVKVGTVGRNFTSSSIPIDRAKSNFIQIIQNSKKLFTKNLANVAAVCLYLALADFGAVISIRDVFARFEISLKGSQKLVNKIRQITGTKRIGFANTDKLHNHIPKLAPYFLCGKDTPESFKITEDICKLFEKLGCTSSMKNHNAMSIACYFALVTIEQKAISLNEYIRKCKLKAAFNKPARNRIKICRRLFIIMIKKLPWITENIKIDENNYFKHIKDVLKAKTFLSDELFADIAQIIASADESTVLENKSDDIMDDYLFDELSEKDIPDSKMEEYIRSEHEVKIIQSVLKSHEET